MIILLNGCINAGKTSVANSIVEHVPNVAHIEVDSLRGFVRWMPLEDSINLNIKNAIDIAKNFDKRGIHSVISYPLSEDNFAYINELLAGSDITVHVVALYPGIDQLKVNRGRRDLTDWEVQRIDELCKAGLATPKFGHVIDNSDQTIEQTRDSVLALVGLS
ncbi:hypothetical protein EOL70_09685 [Leucothrix sargassi]|nr:hypothetical protein EOL70_09685 [Leucothrix sargassi]